MKWLENLKFWKWRIWPWNDLKPQSLLSQSTLKEKTVRSYDDVRELIKAEQWQHADVQELMKNKPVWGKSGPLWACLTSAPGLIPFAILSFIVEKLSDELAGFFAFLGIIVGVLCNVAAVALLLGYPVFGLSAGHGLIWLLIGWIVSFLMYRLRNRLIGKIRFEQN